MIQESIHSIPAEFIKEDIDEVQEALFHPYHDIDLPNEIFEVDHHPEPITKVQASSNVSVMPPPSAGTSQSRPIMVKHPGSQQGEVPIDWFLDLPSPDHPPILDPEWNPWSVPGPQLKGESSDVWEKKGKVNIRAKLSFGRNRFPLPYLEDTLAENFVSFVRNISLYDLWDIRHWKTEEKRRFRMLLSLYTAKKEEVYSLSRISKINNISCSRDLGIKVCYYDIERADGFKGVISDKNFLNMNLRDVELIYNFLRDLVLKPGEVQDALVNIKRFIKFRCRYYMLHDFQMALEAGQERVNRLRPVQYLENMDQLPNFTVVEEPFFGVVYTNEDSQQKKFLRMIDVACFSDGTLRQVGAALHKIANSSCPEHQREKGWEKWKKKKNLALQANIFIRERIQLRECIRRLEQKFGIRSVTWNC